MLKHFFFILLLVPLDMDVRTKATMMGALFLVVSIVMVYTIPVIIFQLKKNILIIDIIPVANPRGVGGPLPLEMLKL